MHCFDSGVIYLDVTGFTQFTEYANEKGHYGVEDVTIVLKHFFDTIDQTIRKYDAEIVKFGGDSCLVLLPCFAFNGDIVQRLHEIRRELVDQFQILNRTLNQNYHIDFHAHGGMAYGKVNINIVGSLEQHLDYFVDGDPVKEAYTLSLEAKADEVLFCSYSKTGYSCSAGKDEVQSISNNAIDDYRVFLPHSVRTKLESSSRPAELKNAALIFLQITPLEDAILDLNAFQAYYTHIQRIVYGWDGIINKIDFTDKGYLMLIVFGIPFIHPDDIERAFVCASIIARIKLPNSIIRIGVNYSNLYAGVIGSEHRYEYGIIGNCVNIAARLMSFAGDGEITLSSEIVPKIDSRFEIERLTQSSVKGIREQITIYRLKRELPERWVFYSSSYAGKPLVMHQQLVKKMQQRLSERTGGDRDCLITVTGEAGTGKSFMVWQLCSHLFSQERPMELFFADRLSSEVPFDILHKVLINKLGIADIKGQYGILQEWCIKNSNEHLLEGLMAFLYPDSGNDLRISQSAQQVELYYDKIAQLVSAMIQNAEIVIVENFDSYDAGSKKVLIRLLRICLSLGQKLIITSTIAPELKLDNPSIVQSLHLQPYTPSEAKRYISHYLSNVTPQAIQELTRVSSGNPQLLAEIVNQICIRYNTDLELITDRVIKDMHNKGLIPDSLENLMLSHYEQLSDDQQQVLKQTAIFGRPFIVEEMKSLFGTQWESKYLEVLDELRVQGLFDTVGFAPSPIYAYVNTILPESIYRTILHSEKVKLHNLIAEFFERKFLSDNSKFCSFIAYHYVCAENKDTMFLWSKNAASIYLKQGSYEQCRFFLQKIADYSEDSNEVCVAELGIIETYLWQSDNERASSILKKYSFLLDLPELTLSQQALFDKYVSLYIRYLNNTADFSTIRDFLSHYLDRIKNDEIRINTHIDYIEAQAFGNHNEEAIAEALPLYQYLARHKKTFALNKLSGVIAQHYVNIGAYQTAMGYYRKKLSFAERLDDAFGQRVANAGLGVVFSRTGRKRFALKYYQKAIELAERTGDRGGYAKALMDMGTLHRNASEVEEAMACYQKSLSIAHHIGNRLLESIVTYNIGELYLFQEDFDAALDAISRSLDLSQKIADFTGVSFCYDALGDALFTQGKLSQAEKMYQKNLKLQTKIGDNEGIAHTWGNLGNIAKLRKDYTLAHKLYKRQFDLISKIGDVEDMGKSRFNMAMVFLEQNDVVLALKELKQALIHFRKCGAKHLINLSEEQIKQISKVQKQG